jgi:hypothetical protein
MDDIVRIVDSCGVLVGIGADGQFAHLATAWSLGGGDWIAAWSGEEQPRGAKLMRAGDGRVLEPAGWECEDGIAGFTCEAAPSSLAVARGATLHKRDRLRALGFPDLVDHPAFRLHHGSLDAERYLPYLCPWTIDGHLVLFSSQDGWLPGRCFPGMAGGPVFNEAGKVVGVLLDGAGGAEQPPLARFRRLD